MPQNAQIVLTGGNLPEGFCPTTEQERFNGYLAQMSGTFPGTFTTWNFGNTVPSADDQDKPWLRTTTTGAPDRIYVYSGGAWLSPHTSPASVGGVGNEIRMWRGTLGDLDIYDGGSTGVVTATTGPFWTEVTEMRVKSPFGVGSIAYTGGTLVVAAKGTAGLIEHELTADQIPKHTHTGSGYDRILKHDGADTTGTVDNTDASGSEPNVASSLVMPSWGGQADGTTRPLGLLHPIYGVYYIQRTGRIYYKI